MVRFPAPLLLVMLLTGLCPLAHAQSVSVTPSGKITYEGLRRVDLSQFRRNGSDPAPGGDAPEGMPDVISFTQKLLFAGPYAKEERDRPQNPMRQNRAGNAASSPDGAPAGDATDLAARVAALPAPVCRTTVHDGVVLHDRDDLG